MATLDEDDILNPRETIMRHQLGIDIDFLVRHVGQEDEESDEVAASPGTVGVLYSSVDHML